MVSGNGHWLERTPGTRRVHSWWAACVLGLGLLAGTRVASAVAETLEARGLALAQACAVCHGPEGRSHGAIPTLHTLSATEISAALHAFRTASRAGTVMPRLAKGLSEADLAAVAAYFAAQPRP